MRMPILRNFVNQTMGYPGHLSPGWFILKCSSVAPILADCAWIP